jgi:hypothetical protein
VAVVVAAGTSRATEGGVVTHKRSSAEVRVVIRVVVVVETDIALAIV